MTLPFNHALSGTKANALAWLGKHGYTVLNTADLGADEYAICVVEFTRLRDAGKQP